MRSPTLRSTALALAVALLVALPAAAYTIYLEDGSKLIARDKYEVRDGKAYFVLESGTSTFIDVDEIDLERTERANRSNLGTAVVIEEGETRDAPTPPPEEPETSLGDLIQQRRRTPSPRPDGGEPADAAASAAAPELPRTPAGFVDLVALERQPYSDLEAAVELKRLFTSQGMEGAQIFQGTSGGTPLVVVSASAEASVFRALAVAASALVQLREQGRSLDALELLITTPSGGRAGQFALTPEMASELLSQRVDISTFFLRNVQF